MLPTMATSDQMYGRVADALLRQSGQDAGLTLVHSMAWLNSAYADDDLDTRSVLTCDGDEAGQGSDRAEADLRPQRWLRGAKRPLLAQFCRSRSSIPAPNLRTLSSSDTARRSAACTDGLRTARSSVGGTRLDVTGCDPTSTLPCLATSCATTIRWLSLQSCLSPR